MKHIKEASQGAGEFHVWPKWGKTVVQYCVAGFSGWVSTDAFDSSLRPNPSALPSDGRSAPIAEGKPILALAKHAVHVCNICGQESANTICEGCSERIRIEALARKKHEENGAAWTHWG